MFRRVVGSNRPRLVGSRWGPRRDAILHVTRPSRPLELAVVLTADEGEIVDVGAATVGPGADVPPASLTTMGMMSASPAWLSVATLLRRTWVTHTTVVGGRGLARQSNRVCHFAAPNPTRGPRFSAALTRALASPGVIRNASTRVSPSSGRPGNRRRHGGPAPRSTHGRTRAAGAAGSPRPRPVGRSAQAGRGQRCPETYLSAMSRDIKDPTNRRPKAKNETTTPPIVGAPCDSAIFKATH